MRIVKYNLIMKYNFSISCCTISGMYSTVSFVSPVGLGENLPIPYSMVGYREVWPTSFLNLKILKIKTPSTTFYQPCLPRFFVTLLEDLLLAHLELVYLLVIHLLLAHLLLVHRPAALFGRYILKPAAAPTLRFLRAKKPKQVYATGLTRLLLAHLQLLRVPIFTSGKIKNTYLRPSWHTCCLHTCSCSVFRFLQAEKQKHVLAIILTHLLMAHL